MPKTSQTAQSIIDNVHSVAPELEVLFMGAAALGLPGKNDIDLDILCKIQDVRAYATKLAPVLGQPKEITEKLAVWEFEKDGFEIDIILSDPLLSHVPEQRKVFEALKASPDLLAKYKKLKELCDGMDYEEYERRKKAFFYGRVLANKK